MICKHICECKQLITKIKLFNACYWADTRIMLMRMNSDEVVEVVGIDISWSGDPNNLDATNVICREATAVLREKHYDMQATL